MKVTSTVVSKSITRLLNAEYIWLEPETMNYLFEDASSLLLFPYEILDADLSFLEKSILLFLRMFCFVDEIEITHSIKAISELSSVNLKTLFTQFLQLEKKKFIDVKITDDKSKSTYFALSSSINWIDVNGHNAKLMKQMCKDYGYSPVRA